MTIRGINLLELLCKCWDSNRLFTGKCIKTNFRIMNPFSVDSNSLTTIKSHSTLPLIQDIPICC